VLRTDWYDERDPLHDFPAAATARFVGEVRDRRERDLAEEQLPYTIEEQWATCLKALQVPGRTPRSFTGCGERATSSPRQ
jgi:hypothetical protein